MVMEWS